ncbi:MAG TPA: hypothetical protein VN922_16485 [Bacteroidia bacterium]|nr:hypothetical protein [Bacteroidia bacterium]
MEELNNTEQDPVPTSDEERKELIWEVNHEKITEAMRYLQRKQVKTTITNIAKLTGLTRKTIYKHLNESAPKPIQKTMGGVNKFMMEEVVEHLCRKACYGDVKAARLYLELMGVIKRSHNTINTNLINNTNAIMVNGLAFTEEMVQGLSPENLAQLEEFVKAAATKSSQLSVDSGQ